MYLFHVMGPHAGEGEDSIFRRKVKEVENIGYSYWVQHSYKAKPRHIQEICRDKSIEVIFLSPSSPGGAKDTKPSPRAVEFSVDGISWDIVPTAINATGIRKGSQALVLKDFISCDWEIDLTKYESLEGGAIKFKQGAGVLFGIETTKVFDNLMKTPIRKVIYKSTLTYPYAIWLR